MGRKKGSNKVRPTSDKAAAERKTVKPEEELRTVARSRRIRRGDGDSRPETPPVTCKARVEDVLVKLARPPSRDNEHCFKLKQQGNEFFKKQNFLEAVKAYTQALMVCEPRSPELRRLRQQCLCNRSAAYLGVARIQADAPSASHAFDDAAAVLQARDDPSLESKALLRKAEAAIAYWRALDGKDFDVEKATQVVDPYFIEAKLERTSPVANTSLLDIRRDLCAAVDAGWPQPFRLRAGHIVAAFGRPRPCDDAHADYERLAALLRSDDFELPSDFVPVALKELAACLVKTARVVRRLREGPGINDDDDRGQLEAGVEGVLRSRLVEDGDEPLPDELGALLKQTRLFIDEDPWSDRVVAALKARCELPESEPDDSSKWLSNLGLAVVRAFFDAVDASGRPRPDDARGLEDLVATIASANGLDEAHYATSRLILGFLMHQIVKLNRAGVKEAQVARLLGINGPIGPLFTDESNRRVETVAIEATAALCLDEGTDCKCLPDAVLRTVKAAGPARFVRPSDCDIADNVAKALVKMATVAVRDPTGSEDTALKAGFFAAFEFDDLLKGIDRDSVRRATPYISDANTTFTDVLADADAFHADFANARSPDDDAKSLDDLSDDDDDVTVVVETAAVEADEDDDDARCAVCEAAN